MKPKILIVGPLPPAAGGITSLLLTILSAAATLTQHYELKLFNIGRPAKANVTNNTGYWVLMNAGLKRAIMGLAITLSHMAKFPFTILWHRPAIVHIHTGPYLSFWESAYYVLITWVVGRSCCLQAHFSFRYFYESSGPCLRTAMLWVIRKTTIFVVISREDITFVEEKDKRRIHCIYLPNSIDVRSFQQSVSQVRKRIKRKEDIVVLFLGGSGAIHKGLFDFLGAIRLLGRSHPRLRFLLVAVPKEQVGHELPADLLLSCEVQGWVSGVARVEVFAKADIFVLPSYLEGMPMSILEAMASSLPVIATRVGGIPDLISEGQEGYLLDPGDVNGLARAIAHLAQDSDKRQTMGRMGLVKAQSLYNVSVAIEQLQSLYDEILKSDRSFSEDMHTLIERIDH